jgi:hypothetical protein
MDGQQTSGRGRHGRVSVLGGGGGFVQTLHFCRYSAKGSQDNVVGRDIIQRFERIAGSRRRRRGGRGGRGGRVFHISPSTIVATATTAVHSRAIIFNKSQYSSFRSFFDFFLPLTQYTCRDDNQCCFGFFVCLCGGGVYVSFSLFWWFVLFSFLFLLIWWVRPGGKPCYPVA